ncbi:hypothetical protein ACJX0J_014533 [Zea mays]
MPFHGERRPVNNNKEITVVRIIIKKWIAYFGYFMGITTTSFRSQEMPSLILKATMNEYGIEIAGHLACPCLVRDKMGLHKFLVSEDLKVWPLHMDMTGYQRDNKMSSWNQVSSPVVSSKIFILKEILLDKR